MPRPANSAFTDSSVTEGGFKTAHDQLNDWLGVLLGSVDTHIRVVRGTEASRPAATEAGWLRGNTDTGDLELTIGTTWRKMVWSVIGATWHWYALASKRYMALFHSTDAGNIVTLRVQNNAGDYADFERSATALNIRISGTVDKVRIIDGTGTALFSIDASGNVIAAGNVTANGTP